MNNSFIEDKWHPLIDHSKCISCGICYDFCPKGVYDRLDNSIVVKNPENCVNKCHGCEWRCPAEAIRFPQPFTKEYAIKVIKRNIEKNKKISSQFITYVTKNNIMNKKEISEIINK